MGDWTLFSNHGHVLICLARDNQARLRSVAVEVGITERAVQKIVRELQEGGFITISKLGRCNRYDINTRKSLRHALEAKCTVGRLLQLFSADEKRRGKPMAEVKRQAGTATRAPQEICTEGSVEHEVGPPQSATQQIQMNGPKKASANTKKKKATAGELPDTRKQGSLF